MVHPMNLGIELLAFNCVLGGRMDVELGGGEVLGRTHADHIRRVEFRCGNCLVFLSDTRIGRVLDGVMAKDALSVRPRISREVE